jgi:putative DNA primase/helicase
MEEDKEIVEVVKELKKKLKIYKEGEKVLASVLAGDIIFKDFDSVSQNGENRGYLVIDSEDSEILYYKDGVYLKNGEQRIKTIAQWVLGDAAKAHQVMEVVSAVKNFYAIRIKRDKLDGYLDLVNLKNCIVNTATLETIQHSKDYYFTRKLNFDYNKDATCPKILKFFNDVHKPEDILLVQEIFGYCLYPTYIYNYIFFLIGSGRNGKGTELNLLISFIGKENITTKAPQEFSDDPYALAYLYGKSADICGDIGSEPLNITILKRASGMDILNGQYKYGHAFDFLNHAKFVFATNLPPPIKDRSLGIWNRLIFIDFQNKFPLGGPNTIVDYVNQLATPDELSGLFNWALIGLQRLKTQGRVSFNTSTIDAMRWYDRKANPVLAFSQDCLEYSCDDYILKNEMRIKFTEYCKKYDLHAVSDQWFTQKLVDALPGCEPDRITINGQKKQIYLNVRLKDDDGNQRPLPTPIEPHTPQKKLNFDLSLEDKINQLLTCLEMYEGKLTLEQLEEQGFSNEFLAKCLERGIIHERPDKTVGV